MLGSDHKQCYYEAHMRDRDKNNPETFVDKLSKIHASLQPVNYLRPETILSLTQTLLIAWKGINKYSWKSNFMQSCFIAILKDLTELLVIK